MKTGFYVSCKKGREEKAFRELVGVFMHLIESTKIYSTYEDINIEDELKKEAAAQTSTPFKIYFKYRSMLFVSNESDLPPSWFYRALRSKNISFSLIQRVVPIDFFFKLEKEKIKSIISNLDQTKTYKIIYEERFVPEDTKLKAFGYITETLNMKVDLTSPYYLLSVQALKNNVGVSIITNELNNFNFSKDKL